MKRTWTIIGVSDVPAASNGTQSLFGQPKTPPGQHYFGQILDTDGTVLLCLHQWACTGILHDEPRRSVTWQWAPLVLPRRRFRSGTEEGTRSRHAPGRRASVQPKQEPRSSHCEISTDTTSRSARSLRPSEEDPRGGDLTSGCSRRRRRVALPRRGDDARASAAETLIVRPHACRGSLASSDCDFRTGGLSWRTCRTDRDSGAGATNAGGEGWHMILRGVDLEKWNERVRL
jgi:hypothetical protein